MYPGTAFTRSIGDAAAEQIGVFAEPEMQYRLLGPNDAFMVIASDGVFEFLPSQSVVDMVREGEWGGGRFKAGRGGGGRGGSGGGGSWRRRRRQRGV